MRSHSKTFVAIALVLSLTGTACIDTADVVKLGGAASDAVDQFPKFARDRTRSCQQLQQYRLNRGGDFVLSEKPAQACDAVHDQEDSLSALASLVSAYFKAIAKLADDKLVGFDDEFKSIGTALESSNALSKDKRAAVTGLASWLAKAATDGYRRKQLATAVRSASSDLQTVLEAMATIVGNDYTLSISNERGALRDYLSSTLRERTEPGEVLLRILVFSEHERRATELNDKTKAAQDYKKALTKMSTAHKKLAEAATVSDATLMSLIGSYAHDLETLIDSTRTAFK